MRSGGIGKRALLVTFMLLTSMLAMGIMAVSSTTKDKFDGGASTVDYDPVDPPAVTLPAGVTILHASLDVEGLPLVVDDEVRSNFNDTASYAWYGTQSQDPPTASPSELERAAIDGTNKDKIKQEDGSYFESFADNGGGPYHHFSFKVTTEPSYMENIKVHWKGRGEEPMIDSLARWRGSIHIWNDNDKQWESLSSYGWDTFSGLKVLEGNVTNNFADYLDVDDRLHVLALSVIFGTPEAYLHTDFIEVTIEAQGGTTYPTDPSLKLEQGGDPVWSLAGPLNTKVTLGDAILKAPIQAMSDAAGAASLQTFTVTFHLGYTGDAMARMSNLSISYGTPPEPVADQITASLDEDTDAPSLIDLWAHFTDDGPKADLVFEVIYEEDATRLDATLAADGHSLSFTTPTDDWYGDMHFGVRVTDGDGLSVEFDGITVSVLPVNDAPVALGIPAHDAVEDEDCSDTFIDLWQYFEDGGWGEDTPQNMTYRLPPEVNPTGGDGTAIGMVLNKRYFTCRPSPDFNGIVTYVVEAKDSKGASVQDSFMVNFAAVNDAPVFKGNPVTTVNENDLYEYEVKVADVDGDPLEVTIVEGPNNMTIEDDVLTWVPGDLDVGTHDVTIEVADEDLSALQEFTIKVMNVNDRPTLKDMDPVKAVVGSEVEVTVRAKDWDIGVDPLESLTFSDDTDLFDVDPVEGTIAFTPVWTQAGTHHANITVTDRLGMTDTIMIGIEVVHKSGGREPSVGITSPENGTEVKVHKAVVFKAKVDNPSTGPWNLTWKVDGEAVAYGEEADIIFDAKGPHVVQVVASDGNGEVTDDIIVVAKAKKDQGDAPGFGMVIAMMALSVAMVMVRALGPRKRG